MGHFVSLLTFDFYRSILNNVSKSAQNLSLKVFLLAIVIVLFGLILFLVMPQGNTVKKSNYSSVQPVPSPTTANNEVHSSDGKMNLVMKKAKESNGLNSYTFFISDKSIFTKRIANTGEMLIPQNSWSPDNKYFFLQENHSGSTDFFVLKVSGGPFLNKEQYISVLPLFEKQVTKYSLSDITGWDSQTLLHVKTNGPPFWFDVESQSFIQLATR